MKVGEKIKELREEAGLTQGQLAERVGVKRNTIWRWENEQANLSPKNREKLSEIFNVAPSNFIVKKEKNIKEKDFFSFECNGQRVEIPANKEYEGLFLEVVRNMRSHQPTVTVNNNAEAHDNAQAVALGDGIKT